MILPAGTQIVTRIPLRGSGDRVRHPCGAVGVIVRSPADADHPYRVRLPDGEEVTLRRDQFAVRKDHQRGPLEAPDTEDRDLREHVVYRCVVGSRAYGLDREGSDTDLRGIYLPPAALHWSLAGVPEQIEYPESEECYWELGKFVVLALKANPNVLECLYTPLVETCAPPADRLLDMRDAFLSRLVYQTYNGYVLSQFRKLEQDLRTRGELRWKHAMHLVRLLLSGIRVLREGLVPLDVGPHRDRLLSIRDGEIPWEEVDRWRLDLHAELDEAYAKTTLPERPDYARVDAFLIDARRSMVDSR